jgi:hypothetical protein
MQHLLRPPPVMLQLVFVFLRGGQHHLLVSGGAEGWQRGYGPLNQNFFLGVCMYIYISQTLST